CFSSVIPLPPSRSSLFPYTTLFRSSPRRSPPPRARGRGGRRGAGPSAADVPGRGSATTSAATAGRRRRTRPPDAGWADGRRAARSEEHTSELQSRFELVCRLLLEKK